MTLVLQNPAAVKSFLSQIRETSSQTITERDVIRLYETSQTVYTIANVRGENVAAVPMEPVDENDEPIDHPVAAVFSPEGNYQDVALRTEICMTILGANLNVPNPDLFGQFTKGRDNLLWINPTLYELEEDLSGRLTGFEIDTDAQQRYGLPRRLDPDDAPYFHLMDFDDDNEGTSPVEAAFYAAGTQVEAFITKHNYFLNRMLEAQFVQPASGYVPPAPPKTPNSPNPIAKVTSALQGYLNRFALGSRNTGRTVVLQDRWEVVNLTGDFSKLAMKEINEVDREAICEALRFVPALLTFTESNYAQSREAIRFWREYWLKPRCLWYAAMYSKFFTKWYGKPVRIKPNFSEILADDDDARIDRATKKVAATFIDLHTAAVEAGVKEPDVRLKGLYKVGDMIVPIDQINQLWTIQLEKSRAGLGMPQPAAATEPTPPVPVVTPPAAPVIPEAGKDADNPSLFVALSLENNADLISLQGQLKSTCQKLGVQCEWNAADTFHITLLYAPSVSDELAQPFIEAVQELPVPDLALKMGSVDIFKGVGENALHFRVRRNPALLEYQAQLHELAQEYGIPLSSYSDPSQYKPHVTMGYLADKVSAIPFMGRFTITPDSVYACRGDDEVWRSGESKSEDDEEESLKALYVPEEVHREIEVAVRKTAKGVAFAPDLLPAVTVEYIQSLIEVGISQYDAVGAAKAHYAGIKAAKVLGAIESAFKDECYRQFKRAQAARMPKSQAKRNMTIMLDRYTVQAFVSAFADSGIEDYVLEDEPEDAAWLRAFVDEQKRYINNVMDTVYADDAISDAEIDGKPEMWWNKSVYPAYLEALSRAAKNGLFEWVIDAAKENCKSCLRLKGQKRTMKFWKSNIMPKDGRLECKGFRCGCSLIPARGKKNRGNLPAWKTFEDDHDHDEVAHQIELKIEALIASGIEPVKAVPAAFEAMGENSDDYEVIDLTPSLSNPLDQGEMDYDYQEPTDFIVRRKAAANVTKSDSST
jgi:2'-5' RNA ligase